MSRLVQIPPVVVLLAAWGVALGAASAVRSSLAVAPAAAVAAGAVALFGALLILWAGQEFRRYRTSIWPLGRPTHLLRSGPFAWSRNPVYVGMALLTTVPAVALGAPAALAGLPVFVAFIHGITIPFEEARLAAAFPDEFPQYCRQVRRWI